MSKTPRAPFIRALEPRLLYDGAAAGTAMDTATDQAYAGHQDAAPSDHGQAHDASQAAKGVNVSQSPIVKALEASRTARDDADGRSAVFIDSEAARDAQDTVRALENRADVDVYLIDRSQGSMADVADQLAQHAPYDTVAVVARGDGSDLSLGASRFDAQGEHGITPVIEAQGEGHVLLFDESGLQSEARDALVESHWAHPDAPDGIDIELNAPGEPSRADVDAINADVALRAGSSVVFVDSNVHDYQGLIDTLDADQTTVVVIDGARDGVTQMADYLHGRHDVSAVHVLSHGGDGQFSLGSASVDAESIEGRYADAFAAIGSAMTADGDLLIYGCDFTGSEAGTEVARQLAEATGADVAGSVDDTGAADLGGDWNLETHIGDIETHALDAAAWGGRLADPISLDFSGNATLVSGTANSVGAVYRFTNVATGVDALVTIDQISNATLVTFDDNSANGIAKAFSPTVSGGSASAFVQFSFRFVDSGTNNARVVSFNANALDVDSTTESIQFQRASNYTTERNTVVSLTVDAQNNLDIRGNGPGVAPTSRGDTRYIVSAGYRDTTSFTYRAGVNGGERFTSLLFENFETGTPNANTIRYADPVTVQLPVAQDDRVATNQNTPVTFNPQANDSAGAGNATVTQVNGTAITAGGSAVALANGSVRLTAAGDFVYTPNTGFDGTESFNYTIRDSAGRISTATVTTLIDNDRDGVANNIDIDDDNDGIRDVDEGYAPVAQTGTWTVQGTSAVMNLGNGVVIRATGIGTDAFSQDSFNANGNGFWSGDQSGDASLATLFDNNDTITFSFEDTSGNAIQVRNPILHMDRIGGRSGLGVQTSQTFTLLNGLTWSQLAGTNDFGATSTSVKDSGDGTAAANGWVASSTREDATGTAAGSLRVNGLVSSFTIRSTGAAADGVGFILEAQPQARDTDGDGKPDYLDIDSDNDGITDNVEAQTTAGYKAPSGRGGTSAFIDANGDGLDDNYDPGALGAAGGIGLTPVDTDSDGIADYRDTDSDNDGMLDIAEAGNPTTTLTGADSDGDGLDNAFDTVSGYDVNDDEIAGDAGGAAGAYTRFTLPDSDQDTNANEAVPNRTGNDAVARAADLDFRDNQRPNAAADTATTNEDTTLDRNAANGLLANDTRSNNQALSVRSFTVNGQTFTVDATNGGTAAIAGVGALTIRADGSYTFVPAANFNGTVPRVTYTAAASNGQTTSTLDITVTPVNDAPVNGVPGAQTVAEDATLTFSAANGNALSVNDVDNDVLTVTLSATNGAISLSRTTGLTFTNGDGTADAAMTFSGSVANINAALAGTTFVPSADYNGSAQLTLTSNDGAASDTDTVAINVTPVTDIAADTATTNEDSPVTINVLANDSFEGNNPQITAINGTSITAGNSVAVTNGVVRLNADKTLTFTPNANYNGAAGFNYTVSSGGVTETAAVTVTVNPVNDAPVNTVPGTQTVAEDATLTFSAANGNVLSVTDVDGDSQTVTLSVTNGVFNLSRTTGLTFTSGDGSADASMTFRGSLANINAALAGATFVPSADYNGSAQLTSASDTDTVAINVTPVADIVADTATTNEDTPVTIDALANDSFEGANPTITAINGTAITVGGGAVAVTNGSVRLLANGQLQFSPAANFNGNASFNYTVASGGVTETAAVEVLVNAVDDAPQNNLPPSQVVPEDSVITFAQANGNPITVQDIDSDTVTVSLTASQGLVTLSRTTGLSFAAGDGVADAAMTFTGSLANVNAALEGAQLAPSPGDYIGNASLTVRSNSGGAQGPSDIDTLQISYTHVADIVDDRATTAEDTSAIIDVLANDSFENPNASVSAINGTAITAGGSAVTVSNGSVRLLADGRLQFTPTQNFNGDTSFNYTVATANNTETATVTVAVTPVNDAPVVTAPLPDRSGQDGDTITIATAGAFSDVDGDTLTYSAAGLPAGLSIDANTGQITGNLPSDASVLGPYEVVVTARDGNGGVVSDTFSITSRNVAPTAGADTATTGENTASVGNVLANDIDGGNDRDTLTVGQVEGAAGNVGQPVAGSSGGTFTVAADGSYTFDPGTDFDDLAADESRTSQISYTVSDGQGGRDTTTLTVTVVGANDAPIVATPLDNQASSDGDTVSLATAGSFLDVDGNDTLTYSAANLPPGLSIDAATGQISGRLSPDASQGAPYRVSVVATDGAGKQAESIFTWAVANPAPVAGTDSATTTENAITTGNVLANDVDGGDDTDTLTVNHVNGDPAAVGLATAGDAGGAFTIAGDGSYVFDPGTDFDYLAAGETATTRVIYQVSDGQGGTDTSVLTLTVTGTNDVPVAQPVPDQAGSDGQSVNLPTAGYFSDADVNDTPSFDATGLPPGLSIDPATGVITGQFAADASQRGDNGRYTVTVSIDDGQGGTASTSFDWTIVNLPVNGVDDAATTTEDTAVSRDAATGVLANDLDPDNDPLTVTSVNNTAANVGGDVVGSNGGTFNLNADGSYDFDPGADFQYLSAGESATTSVIYQVSDGQGGLDTARLTVTVTGINDAPQVDSPLQDLANGDGETVSVPTAGAFTDVDANDNLSFSVDQLPPGLTLDPATGVISGTLSADASQGGADGVYTITVTADDGNGGTATSTFDWAVTNRPPIANDDGAATTENAAAISGNVIANDTDGGADSDTLTVAQVNAAAGNVSAAVGGSNGGVFIVNADGSYSFSGNGDFDRLAEGQTATTSVTYQVSDGQGGTDTATLTVTVTGTNDAPIVRTPLGDLAANDGDSVSVPTAGAFRDPDTNDTLTYSATGLPPGLSLNTQTGVISGIIDRSASQNAGGQYNVVVTASDGRGGSVSDTFAWNIANRRPVAGDDTASTGENTPASGNVLGNDRDGANDTDPLVVDQVDGRAGGVGNAVAGGNGGAFTINADGSYTFEPGTDFDDLGDGETRMTSVTYQVSDGQGGTDTARLVVTVTGTNDAPVVVGGGLADLSSNNSEVVSVPTVGAFNDVDANDTLTYSATGLPEGLTIDPATGIISGMVDPNAAGGGPNNDGVYTVTVTASDGTAQVQSRFDWTINNQPVVATDDINQTGENQPLAVDAANGVTANDIDADGGGIEVIGVAGAMANVGNEIAGGNGGVFVINEDGSYSFDPGADFDYLSAGDQASTSVTYQIADEQGASDTARLTVTVTGANDAPTVVRALQPLASGDGDTVTVPTAGSFVDVDRNDTLTFSASNLPPGLSVDSATGVISGRIDAAASAGGPDGDGRYSVVVSVNDGTASVDTAFTWTVTNRVPVAVNDTAAVTVGDTASGNVIAGAADGTGADRDGGNDTDPLTVSSVNGLAVDIGTATAGDNGGTFTIAADGSYVFDPGTGFDGLAAGEQATTSVVYQISDGQGGTDEARLTVTVTGVNDPPTVVGDGLVDQSNNDGEAVSIPTAAAFDDVDDNDTLTFSADDGAGGSTLPPGLSIDAATGRITGSLTADASQGGPNADGVYTVTITATDAAGTAVSTAFTWSVANVAPNAVDDSAAVTENQSASGNVLVGPGADRDGGPDTDPLTVVDVDGSAVAPGQPATVPGDLGGTFTLDADGDYTFAPGTDFDGLAAGETAVTGVTYRISDGQGGFDSARLTVTVTGTNDAPTVDSPLPDLAANDGDAVNIATADAFADLDSNDALTYSATGLPDGVTIDSATGQISGRLSPDASQGGDNGSYSVIVTVRDSAGATVSDTFSWTIANPAPIAALDTASTTENTAIDRAAANGVLANDTDGNRDTDTLTVSSVGGAAANVGQGITGSGGGQFTINPDGSYRFDPGNAFDDLAVGESRETAVTYQISDGQGGTAMSRLVVTVTGGNDAPVVVTPLPDLSDRDGDAVSISVADVFSDADASDRLTYSALDANDNNTLPPGLTLDPDTGRISGTISADASLGGPYTVTVSATDPSGAQVSTVFTWRVANPAPVAAPDTAATDENTPVSADAIAGVLANDVDGGNDRDTLTVSQVEGSDANVGVAVAGSNGGSFTLQADGSYTFEPGADFDDLAVDETRTTQIAYQVSDGQGGFDISTLTVTVTGTNDAPTVATPTPDQSARDGDTVSIDAAAAFADRDAADQLTYSAQGLPNGLTIDPDTGLITGMLGPDASQNGPFSVTVTADDGNGGTVSDSFQLAVANVAPVATADNAETAENDPVTGNALANDTDGGDDTDMLVVSQVAGDADSVGQPTAGNNGGLFTVAANGDYRFDPGTDFDDLAVGESRTTTVSYQVSDGQGGTATASITVLVMGANDAPTVAQGTPDQTARDGDTLSIAAGAAFADADVSDTLRYTADGLPAGLSIDPDTGLISGTLGPNASQNGPFSVTVTADDGNGGLVTDTFTITAANVVPVAGDDAASTTERDPVTGNVLANDRDGSADTDLLTVSAVGGDAAGVGISVAGSNGGTFTVDANGNYRFDPGVDFADLGNGQTRDSLVIYQVSDGQGGTATATLTVTVTGGNDAPVVTGPMPDQTARDGDTVSIAAGNAFSDAEGDDLSYSADGLPAGLSIDPDTGLITGMLGPDASANGPFEITVTADDGNGGTVSDTFILNATNVAPAAMADSASTSENTPATGNVLANDVDGGNDRDTLVVSQVGGDGAAVGTPVAGRNGGAFTVNADGSYTFEPGVDFEDLAVGESRSTSVDYQVSDGQGGFDTATLTVTVDGRNDAPTVVQATPDQSARDGDTLSIAAGAAFADADASDRLVFSATGLPDGLSIDAGTGRITGTLGSDASANGPFSVTVTADDGNGGTTSDTFVILATNVAPVARADTNTTEENSPAFGSVLANDTDGGNDGDTLVVAQVDGDAANVGQAVAGGNGGTFTINADGSYLFQPGTDFDDLGAGDTRTTTIAYQVSDGQGGTDTQTVTVTVTGTNDAPAVVDPTPDQNLADGDAVSIAAGDAFIDVEGDALAFTADGLPAGLTIDPDTGRITGTLDANASINGPFAITVTATDDDGAAVSQRFTITATNVAPVAAADTATTDENTPATGNVLANDIDGGNDRDALTVSEVGGDAANVGRPTAGSNGGSFTIGASGGYSFDPGTDFDDLNAGESRTTTIRYQVSDGQGGFDTETVAVTVTGVNDAPVVAQPTAPQRASDGDAVAIAAGSAFADADNGELSYTATGLPDGLTIDPDTGLITGTLGANASQDGPYIITVTADDGQGGTVENRFTLTADNMAPVAAADSADATENTPTTGNVLTNDRDGGNDSDTLTVSQVGGAGANVGQATAGSNGGTFTIAADGSYTFDPGADFDDLGAGQTRTSTISYQVSDGQGGVDTQTVTVTVTGANDAPTVVRPTPDQTANDGDTVSIAAGDAFTDAEGDTLTYSAAGLPAGLSIDPDTGLITGTLGADASANGPYTVTVTASDGNGGTVTNQFTLTPANVAPTASPDTATTGENTPATGNVLANDRDGGNDSDDLTVSQVGGNAANVGQPTAGRNGGTFTIDADGSYTFDPGADFDDLGEGQSRTTTISYQVSDGQGGFDTETVTVTVTGANDAPMVARPTPDQTARDGDPVSIAAGEAFRDPEGDTLTFTADNLPEGLRIDADTGLISGTLTAAASANGPYTIRVTADDGNGGQATSTFELTPANQPPLAAPDRVTTGENTPATGNVLANDIDGGNDSDPLTVSQVGGNAAAVGTPTRGSNGGSFTVNANGSYTFEPGADFDDLPVGQARTTTISYQVSDGQGGFDTATLTVTVTGANDAPVVSDTPLADRAGRDSQDVVVGTAGGFTDVDRDTLTYSATNLPPGLSIDPDTGVISGRLTPSASQGGDGGIYRVVITANDGQGGTVSQAFDWSISNDPPIANDDLASTTQGRSITVSAASGNGVLANDSDPDGDGITLIAVDGAAGNIGRAVAGDKGGLFTIGPDGSYTFDPNGDFAGLREGQSATTTVTYRIDDDNGGTALGRLVVVVNGANDAPTVARPTPDQTANDGDRVVIRAGEAFADADRDTLTYTAAGLPPGLSIDPRTGLITGRLGPDASANGPYTVTITANDGNGGTVTDRFALTPANVAPVARPDSAVTGENTPATGNVLANDRDGGNDSDTLTVTQVGGAGANVGQSTAGSNGGTFTIAADGSYTFAPGTDFDDLGAGQTRTSTISYRVSDGQGGFDTETVTVTVTGTNDAPTVARPTPDRSADDGDTLSIAAGDAFRDAEGDDLSFTATGLPAGLTIDPDTGLITGTLGPDASVNGPYTITVTANDGNGRTAVDRFTIAAANRAPVAAPDAATAGENTPTTGNVLANDRDGGNDSDTLTVSQVGGAGANVGQATAGSNGGTFTIAADGSYTFDPGADFDDLGAGQTRTSTISYQVSDGQGGVDTQTVTVTVTGANDAPTVVRPTPDQTANDGDTVSIAAGDAFTDAEGDTLTYSAAGLPAGLSIDPDTGLITGTLGADASANGPYTVTVTASDGNGGTVTNQFTLTPANVAPTASPDTATTGENTPATGNVLANDRDGGNDSDDLTVSQVGGNAANVGQPTAGRNGGTFTIDADGSYTFDPGADFDDLGEGQSRTTTISYQVSDGQGGFDTQTVTVTVDGAVDAVGTLPDRDVAFGAGFRADTASAFDNAGLAGPLRYGATGLPQGLSIDPQTGVISGNPIGIGDFDIVVTVTSARGTQLSSSFTLGVSPPAVYFSDEPGTIPGLGQSAGQSPSLVTARFAGLAPDIDTRLAYEPIVSDGLLREVDFGFGLPREFEASGVEAVNLRFQATQTDGSPLPGTLTVNSQTGELSGRLPDGMSQARLTVIAVDDNGNTRTQEVWVDADGHILPSPTAATAHDAVRTDAYRRSEFVIHRDGTARMVSDDSAGNRMAVQSITARAGRLAIDIADPQAGAGAGYSASLADGSPLPPGLTVDERTGDIRGEWPAPRQQLNLRVIAEGTDGTTRVLEIDISNPSDAGRSAWRSLADEADAALADIGDGGRASYGARIAAAFRS
ncbi:Ig-like domain-containing protein [Salinisphaera sp. T31B1]|uniref:Ig-like domain-containing protein n=1 Tax=Salinisphaera sp. T31B1 TaxID=727963 RepID=UPI00334240AF